MYEGFSPHSRIMKALRKLVVAVVMTLLLVFLGILGGVGYHLHWLNETSFDDQSYMYGYADVTFNCALTYDPVIYPLYWLMGQGHIDREFRIMYIPETYTPGEFGHAVYLSRSQRENSYVMYVIMWGILPNMIMLLSIAIAIEALGKRSLYFVIFGGITGFALSFMGVFLGLAVGGIVAFLIMRKVPPFSFLTRLWDELFKREPQ
jgi:hypothetical protein